MSRIARRIELRIFAGYVRGKLGNFNADDFGWTENGQWHLLRERGGNRRRFKPQPFAHAECGGERAGFCVVDAVGSYVYGDGGNASYLFVVGRRERWIQRQRCAVLQRSADGSDVFGFAFERGGEREFARDRHRHGDDDCTVGVVDADGAPR